MNSNYILPVSVAAAIHGVLLFGFTKSPKPPPIEKPPTDMEQFVLVNLEPEIEIPEPITCSGQPTLEPPSPRPASLEPIVLEVPTRMTMERPAFEPMMPDNTSTIVPQSFINPGGADGNGPFKNLLSTIDLDNSPRTRFQPAPHYPPAGKVAGLAGEVMVEFTVDEGGRVIDPRVVKSSDRMFEEPTLRAVAKWQFEPGRRAGRIVRFRMAVPVVFNLNE